MFDKFATDEDLELAGPFPARCRVNFPPTGCLNLTAAYPESARSGPHCWNWGFLA